MRLPALTVLCVTTSGDPVSACDVSDRCCEEGHGHPGEERVLHLTDRERGGCVLHGVLLSLIAVLEGSNRFQLSAEAQDPDTAAPGSAGCRSPLKPLLF